MNRSDGYKLRSADPFYEMIPYIMKQRNDAVNYVSLQIDRDAVQNYVNDCKKRGINMKHMSVVIAAYLRLVSQNPYLNRFVVNKKIYARNHFCVTFVALKGDTETVIKLYFNLDDDIFEVNRKVTEGIEKNQDVQEENSMDIILKKIMQIPFLVGSTVALLKWWDKHFSLPFKLVDASPFHSSLFITNLASIRLDAVYHHIYNFGTTSIFIAMGKTKEKLEKASQGEIKQSKYIPLKISTDERIASGYYFAKCFREFNRYIKNPKQLEEKPDHIVKDPHIKTKNPKFIVKE